MDILELSAEDTDAVAYCLFPVLRYDCQNSGLHPGVLVDDTEP